MKTKMQKETRTLTIQRDTRYGFNYAFRQVPKLLLTGIWFKKAGFLPGEKVQVEIRPRRIILKPGK